MERSAARADARRRGQARRRVRVPREARRAVLLLPRPRRLAGGAHVRPDAGLPRHRHRHDRGADGADRRSACCGGRPTCSAIRATRPARPPTRTPPSTPSRRRRSSRCSRRPIGSVAATTSCGAAARATRRCSTPTWRARRRSSPGSCTMVAEHKHRIGFKGTLLIEPKPQEPTKHQYDYDGAIDHGLPRAIRPGRRVPAQPRGEPRDAGGAQLPPRGRLRHRPRRLRQHRRQPRRLPERLGHGPVPELGRRAVARGLRDHPRRRVHDRRLQLRHQAASPEHGPDGPVPRPHRRHRHARAVAPRRGLADRGRRARAAPPGALCRLGGQARPRDPRRATIPLDARASVFAGDIDPRPVSGAQERLESLVNRHIWAADRTATSSRAPVAERGSRPRDRRLDDRDQGDPGRRDGGGPRRRRRGIRLRDAASALERAGPGAVVGRRGRGDRRGAPRHGDTRRGRRRGRADRADARAGPARRRRTACSGRRSCGTTSGPPPNAT